MANELFPLEHILVRSSKRMISTPHLLSCCFASFTGKAFQKEGLYPGALKSKMINGTPVINNTWPLQSLS